MKKRTIFQTSFVLLVLFIIFAGGDVQAVDQQQVFLPVTLRNYCSNFFDDFSNPNSGWDVVDDDFEHTEYLNGEYRVLTKQSGYYYTYLAPTCSHENYVVEVDVRWASETAHSYGITFGVLPDFSQYYIFDMNTDYREFRVLHRGSSGFSDIVPITSSSAINDGLSSNHLKITRIGNQITLEVNGIKLGTWSDSTITGPTFAGLLTWPYSNQPISDARFDNFSITSIDIPTTGFVSIPRWAITETGGNEWVEIFNADIIPIQLKNWTLEDGDHNVFTFPYYVLNPSQSCRVYTNEIHTEYCGFSFGSDSEIWDNDGDHLYLRDANGTLVFEDWWP